MMARRWSCWSLGMLLAVLGSARALGEGLGPRNVTVIPGIRSLDVLWKAPDLGHNVTLESYRVRVYSRKHDALKRVQWVPARLDTLRQTISCLEPNTEYVIQVFTRYSKSSNLSDRFSEVIYEYTLQDVEEDILLKLWQQRLYVAVGAVLMVVIFLVLTPFICCCCCRTSHCHGRRRKRTLANKEEKNMLKKKKQCEKCPLPSAEELREREHQRENNYTPDPVESATYRQHNRVDFSSTNPRSPLIRSQRPSCPSMPREKAPDRPPMPWANEGNDDDEDVFDPDEPDYVNGVFNSGAPAPVQCNADRWFARDPAREAPVYGNCQF